MPISEFKSKADLDRAYDILVNAKLLKEKPKAN